MALPIGLCLYLCVTILSALLSLIGLLSLCLSDPDWEGASSARELLSTWPALQPPLDISFFCSQHLPPAN